MKKALLTLAVISFVVAGAGTLFLVESSLAATRQIKPSVTANKVKKFTSAAEFKSYLAKAARKNVSGYGGGVMMRTLAAPSAMMEKAVDSVTSNIGLSAGGSASIDRYSSTNVQVTGIDEPDFVKTDGNNVYLSSQYWYPIYYARPMMGVSLDEKTNLLYPNYNYLNGVKTIKANPPSDLKLLRSINAAGNLLLSGNVLMVFEGNRIKGYDVNASGTDKELWNIEYPERDTLVGARLYGGKLYLATKQSINYGRPCPYQPFTAGLTKIIIPCRAIYYPVSPVPTDILYTVSAFDARTGKSLNQVSFTGSSDYSILYMSPNAMYVTYFSPGEMTKFSYNFLAANKDLIPNETIDRLAKLVSYDLSEGTKQNELSYILNQWQSGLERDEVLKVQNELQNRMAKYYPLHMRELEKTSIVKTSINDFKVLGVGTVPGKILNQFSMDEYNNNLRVAVTVGQTWFSLGNVGATTKSMSDVYVLGESLATLGSVKDLGEGEQIYSARFIGDRGYVVTFRQTDPFYVLDLSVPASPKLAGELKVPGYSSYLEPLGTNTILGVGKEDNKVKLALYDVSDAKNPIEKSKYILDEYWSAALGDHHAFLKDEKFKVFFIPGSQGGYVFDYSGGNLLLQKAVSDPGIERALYINDALYLISKFKISVWDENNWNKLNELNLNDVFVSNQGSSGATEPIKIMPVLPSVLR